MSKTYKRELAVVLLLWFAYIVEAKEVGLIEILVWPVFTYSALAFGLDWFNKSGGMQQAKPFESPHRRGSKRSSECPGGEDKYPDLRDDQGR